MKKQGDQTIKMPGRTFHKWLEAHPIQENGEISHQNGKGMPDGKVAEAGCFIGCQVLRTGHYLKRPDIAKHKFGVVLVMVVV